MKSKHQDMVKNSLGKKFLKFLGIIFLVLAFIPFFHVFMAIVTIFFAPLTSWYFGGYYFLASQLQNKNVANSFVINNDIKVINIGVIDPQVKDAIVAEEFVGTAGYSSSYLVDSQKIYVFYNERRSISGLKIKAKGLTLRAFDKSEKKWGNPIQIFNAEYNQVSFKQIKDGEILVNLIDSDLTSNVILISKYGIQVNNVNLDFDKAVDLASVTGIQSGNNYFKFTGFKPDPLNQNNKIIFKPSLKNVFLMRAGYIKAHGLKDEDKSFMLWSDRRNNKYSGLSRNCSPATGCGYSPEFENGIGDLMLVFSDEKGTWGSHMLVGKDIGDIDRAFVSNGWIYFVTSDGHYGDIKIEL